MRELKFRAYDKDDKVMYEMDDVCTVTDVFNIGQRYDTLMQFTGLTDKNGKEIYEGDIVTVDRKDSFDKYNEAIIVFGVGSFLLEYTRKAPKGSILIQEATIKSDDTTVYDRITSWDIEVIGNIYEKEEP